MEDEEIPPVRDERKGKAKVEETDQQSLPESLNQDKEMEDEEVPPVRDEGKGKAKVEETDQHSLPESTPILKSLNQGKDMEDKEAPPVRDERKGKAKVEETDQQSLPESLNQGKEMEDEGVPPVRAKRKGKAKVEETDQHSLPESIPIVNNIMHGDIRYLKLIGHQRKRTVSAEELQRKFYRVRSLDVSTILGKEDERLRNIHSASGATIGIISDPAGRIHRQLCLELLGTPDEVKIAELLIVDAITETYEDAFIPTALMPEHVLHHRMTIPLSQVVPLLGIDGTNIGILEKQSGAWIELNTYPPVDANTVDRAVDIYGHQPQITKAIELIMNLESVISEKKWEVDIRTMTTIAEEDEEDQESEDEKQKDVEKDGSGEKASDTQIGTPQHVEEAEDKESGESGSVEVRDEEGNQEIKRKRSM